jgi:predicted HicB family RNase H-like nuclease
MNEMTAIDLRDVPEKIVRAVERDAARTNSSVNDTVVRVLSEAANVPVEPTGYPSRTRPGSDHWNVRMPVELREAVRKHAAVDDATITAFVFRALAERYRLALPATGRRTAPRFSTRQTNEIRRRHGEGESIRALSRRYGAKRETIARVVRAEG